MSSQEFLIDIRDEDILNGVAITCADDFSHVSSKLYTTLMRLNKVVGGNLFFNKQECQIEIKFNKEVMYKAYSIINTLLTFAWYSETTDEKLTNNTDNQTGKIIQQRAFENFILINETESESNSFYHLKILINKDTPLSVEQWLISMNLPIKGLAPLDMEGDL